MKTMIYEQLFKDFYFLPNSRYPIYTGKLNNELILELDTFINAANKIKNHPLGFLKNHKNAGDNSFQVSVPNNLINNSFMFPFLNYLGEYYLHLTEQIPIESLKRKVTLRENSGHFDLYDFWVNYSEPGDKNDMHRHSGMLSGVIYFNNDIELPTKFEDNFLFNGTKGDIIIFPSFLWHGVDSNTTNNTRITFAFNLEYFQ